MAKEKFSDVPIGNCGIIGTYIKIDTLTGTGRGECVTRKQEVEVDCENGNCLNRDCDHYEETE